MNATLISKTDKKMIIKVDGECKELEKRSMCWIEVSSYVDFADLELELDK